MDTNSNPLIRGLLSPFSSLYNFITSLRNQAFDAGLLEKYQSPIPTIAIGNLSVGGTGKTPMTEFLIKNLKVDNKAVISRGYGRKSKGLLKVDPQGSAVEFGDESLQIAQKFPIKVWVSEERKLGLKAAEAEAVDLILLDDAFQHRYVKANRYLMLSRFDQPFFSDHVLPGGSLRESRNGAQRADFIIFTKCPSELSEELKQEYRFRSAYYSDAPVLFADLVYGDIEDQNSKTINQDLPIVLISGIADNSALLKHLQSNFKIAEVLSFKDHHAFKAEDISAYLAKAEAGEINIVCTDKDRVKLGPLAGDIPLFSVPVEHRFSPEDQKLLLDDLQGLISF